MNQLTDLRLCNLSNLHLLRLLARVGHIVLAASLLARDSRGAKLANDQPGRDDGDGVQRKVEVDATNSGEDGDRGQAVADGLPARLGGTKEGGVADDFVLVLGEVVDDEVAIIG